MDISVSELKNRLSNNENILIIDVREELEYHTFNIDGKNIPLGKLMALPDELGYNKGDELVVVCQRGLRSETARQVLANNGYFNVKNLLGGLLAWRKEIK